MTEEELIEHLKSEIKRVKEQRNDYEQRWMKAIRETEELKHLHNLPSYTTLSIKGLERLKD